MTLIVIKISICIITGFFAGPAAVFVFNRIPARWLCEYKESPSENPRFTEELKDPHFKRIKENPCRWVYAVAFICLMLRVSLIEYSSGFIDVQNSISLASSQLAVAALISCWLLLIIALADMKYMIIPDQFVLLLAVSSIGFLPTFKAVSVYEAEGAGETRLGIISEMLTGSLTGFMQPLIGMCIGGGVMLLAALAGRLIFKADAFGFGDVKLCAALGLVLGIKGIIATLLMALILSGFVAAAGLATGKYRKTDSLPLGTYLCGCAMAYIFIAMPLML